VIAKNSKRRMKKCLEWMIETFDKMVSGVIIEVLAHSFVGYYSFILHFDSAVVWKGVSAA